MDNDKMLRGLELVSNKPWNERTVAGWHNWRRIRDELVRTSMIGMSDPTMISGMALTIIEELNNREKSGWFERNPRPEWADDLDKIIRGDE